MNLEILTSVCFASIQLQDHSSYAYIISVSEARRTEKPRKMVLEVVTVPKKLSLKKGLDNTLGKPTLHSRAQTSDEAQVGAAQETGTKVHHPS